MAEQAPTPAFAILVRHPGWIDQMLSPGWESAGDYPPRRYVSDGDFLVLPDRAEADRVAAACAEKWGQTRGGWQFTVVERRHVPRWYIVEPQDRGERRAVGSREQIGGYW